MKAEEEKIRAIIVDDEKKARQGLKSLIDVFISDLLIIGEAENVETAKTLIANEKPDLVFLDIEMPGGNGFTLLSGNVNIDFEVIFTTAYSEYAIKAIKHSAFDYLLKPIDHNELQKSIEKLQEKRRRADTDEIHDLGIITGELESQQQNAKIILPVSRGFKVFLLSDLLYLEASGSYTNFYFKNTHKLTASKNLKHFEERFGKIGFFRVHDRYMVNLNHVESYIRGRGGDIVLSNGTQISVSREKKSAFLEKFSKWEF